MSMTFPDEARTLGALLRAPYEKLSERLYGSLAARGFPEVRPAHSAVLRNLEADGSRLTELARRAGMAKQSMAYLVGDLEEHGYLRTRPDPADARARLVQLTPRGGRLVEAMVAASFELERAAAARLGAEQVKALRNQLAALDEALAEEHPHPEGGGD